ncbi:unnamed protein product [Leuciscus chuanchicus]
MTEGDKEGKRVKPRQDYEYLKFSLCSLTKPLEYVTISSHAHNVALEVPRGSSALIHLTYGCFLTGETYKNAVKVGHLYVPDSEFMQPSSFHCAQWSVAEPSGSHVWLR